MEIMERKNRTKGEGSIYRHTDGRWMYSIMHKGKRLAKSLGTRDEEAALKKYQKVRNNFMGRIDRGELEPSTRVTVTLDAILDDYIEHIKANGHKSAKIIDGVINRVRSAREFGNGEEATRKVASLETVDFK